MEEKRFNEVSSTSDNNNWDIHIAREKPLYKRENDIRSPYERDYTRILHSLAYRRLKHKTQVFFNIDNDHICIVPLLLEAAINFKFGSKHMYLISA